MFAPRTTKAAGRATSPQPVGHRRLLLMAMGAIALIVAGIGWGAYLAFDALSGGERTAAPTVTLNYPKVGEVEEVVVVPTAVPEEPAPAAEDPFADTFPEIDVDWKRVEDLSTIPPALDPPYHGTSSRSSKESALWAAQFFPKMSVPSFVDNNPAIVWRHRNGTAQVAFISITSWEVEGLPAFSLPTDFRFREWFLVSLDDGDSWTKLASWPVMEGTRGPLALGGPHKLRVQDEGDRAVIFVKTNELQGVWMEATVKKPPS